MLRPLRLKMSIFRPATQSRYVTTLRDRRNFKRLCATQKRYVVATSASQNGYFWDFVQPKYLRDVSAPKRDMLRLCAASKKAYCDH